MRPALVAIVLLAALALGPRICSAQAAPTGNGAGRAARIKADLRDILSDPEYHPSSGKGSALERIGKWLQEEWDGLKELFGRLFRVGGRAGAGSSQVMYWLVLFALAAGMVYLVIFVARHYGARLSRRGRALHAALSVDEEHPEREDPERWLALARELAAAGDLRRAYRAAFIAVLLRLDRLGAIRYERSRTNGEYLRALRARPPLLAILRPLAGAFDAHWYGAAPVSEQGLRDCLAAYERVDGAAR